jgi:hypothetical protein
MITTIAMPEHMRVITPYLDLVEDPERLLRKALYQL